MKDDIKCETCQRKKEAEEAAIRYVFERQIARKYLTYSQIKQFGEKND